MQKKKSNGAGLTLALVEAIGREIRAGKTIRQIAQKYGLTEEQVRHLKRRFSLECELPARRPTKGERELAYYLKRLGLSEAYIARLLGVKARCLFRS